MTRFFLLCLFLTGLSQLSAQSDEYKRWVDQADSLYQADAFRAAGEAYHAAFATLGGKGYINDRYNAACAWALAGVPDSAFLNLLRISRSGHYTDYDHLITDPDLRPLYDDPRWSEVTELVKASQEKAEANRNPVLIARLDSVFQTDQGLRQDIDSVMQTYGRDSKEMQAHWARIAYYDSIHTLIVTDILDQYGWLGADVVGGKGSLTLFLVIQHAPLEVQQKYLPMMREAVEEGRARASSLALLEDRVALGQGERQVYGSQIGYDEAQDAYYVLPLQDPLKVDERRAKVGLPPLAEYVSNWDIEWDAEAYLEKLPELEGK